MRRARETADCIAAVTGLAAQPDARLQERLNWDGGTPFDAFLELWARTARDRDLAPPGWPSARMMPCHPAYWRQASRHAQLPPSTT
jgi:broad specificity phosphatase PhoE